MLSKTTVHHFSGTNVALVPLLASFSVILSVSDLGDPDVFNFTEGIAATLPPTFARSASYATPSSTGLSRQASTSAVVKQFELLGRHLPRFTDGELRGLSAGADAAACSA
ncbi:hypothetical protein B0H17DRAFT_1197417 [Mycena rosella]|uniref:Secreted protein n=1 Tax=Mycena rosella TaxID=1033263 RepID=A0AAD7DR18_MYCRO|nr:hypothetical protein B0H17DRAFT_1197417 [Mycena rosella]